MTRTWNRGCPLQARWACPQDYGGGVGYGCLRERPVHGILAGCFYQYSPVGSWLVCHSRCSKRHWVRMSMYSLMATSASIRSCQLCSQSTVWMTAAAIRYAAVICSRLSSGYSTAQRGLGSSGVFGSSIGGYFSYARAWNRASPLQAHRACPQEFSACTASAHSETLSMTLWTALIRAACSAVAASHVSGAG